MTAEYAKGWGYVEGLKAAGYELSTAGLCTLRVCSGCVNGIAAEGTACATHAGTTCASCSSGYELRPDALAGPARWSR